MTSPTAFYGLLSAVHGSIIAAPEMTGVLVSVGRRRPLSRDGDKAVFIALDGSQAGRVVNGAMDWSTRIVVECIARAAAPQSPESAVDELLHVVHAQVLAVNQAIYPSLIDIAPSPELDWDSEDLDTNIARVRIAFTANHRTQEQSLTAWE